MVAMRPERATTAGRFDAVFGLLAAKIRLG
jgi:hypothetical protein